MRPVYIDDEKIAATFCCDRVIISDAATAPRPMPSTTDT